MFQSHLYGIESCDACRLAAADRRFNRTFMELKVDFQEPESILDPVSIAPLWN